MRPAQRTDQPLTLHYRRVAIAESLIQLDVWLLGLALAHWGTSLREPLPTVIAVAASSRTEQSSPDLAGLPKRAQPTARRLKAEIEADERRSIRATYGETCRVGGNGSYLCGRGSAYDPTLRQRSKGQPTRVPEEKEGDAWACAHCRKAQRV